MHSATPGWLFVVGFLLAARYLQPTEGVAFGETLWQAQIWLIAAAVWCWHRFRAGDRSLRFSLLDGCVWTIAAGHAISTVRVLIEGGDRRAAVNIAWEWVGLAAALFLIRQVLDGREQRRALSLFAAMAVALAGLGIWQHHVGLAQTTARYDEMLSLESELGAKIASGDATTSDRARFAEVQREMAESGVPSDPAARARWENRVKFSTEPFATFALANTLGGLLAAALPLLAVHLWPTRRSLAWVGIGASFLIVLYCLFLTKSRTAWVGLIVGTAAAIGLQLVRGRVNRKILGAIVGAAGAVTLFGLIVLATGGLDLEVFSEAPKSLRYRLDYWTGTMRVLAEHPVLGTGPGNFRGYYLEHRVLGASEEIAAPHNLFLDVWVSGGVLALAGLIGFLAFVAFRLMSQPERSEEPGETATAGHWSLLEWGATLAFPAVAGLLFLAGMGIDLRLLVLCPVFAAVAYCLIASNAATPFSVSVSAGFVALTVHLLGADGMELPAVVQTLLVLALFLDRSRENAFLSGRGPVTAFSGFAALALGCLLTGFVPVLNSAALVARAESLIADGDPAADLALVEAAEADPLATRPLILRAELAQSRATATRSRGDFRVAEERWREVLNADPRGVQARRRLAELLLAKQTVTRSERSTAEALTLIEQAVELSPTDVALHVELANALAASGQPSAAADAARTALAIDDINREAGHTDILLNEQQRAELAALADIGNPAGAP